MHNISLRGNIIEIKPYMVNLLNLKLLLLHLLSANDRLIC